jgi:hypothetical protein
MVGQLAGIGACIVGERDDGDDLLAPTLAGPSGDDHIGHRGMRRDRCLVFFAAELAVRLWKARFGFFRSPWATIDALIIIVALLPVLGADASLLSLAKLSRMVHLGKHVSGLRLGGCSLSGGIAHVHGR